MEVSAHIDWISATFRGVTYARAGKGAMKSLINYGLHKSFANMKWIESKARNGYTNAMQSETGIVLMSNPERSDMGLHMVMSGATLAKNEEFGLNQTDLLNWIVDGGHRLSRIDYAVNAKNSGVKIENLAKQIEEKKHKSRARTAPYIDDKIRNGKTQYVGSLKNRTKLFRGYDKGAELGLDLDWKRFELELHGQHAVNSASIARNGGNLAETIQGLIKAFVDFPNDEIWQSIFSSDEIWLAVPEIKQGNTELWLLTQCAPALARVLDLNESFMYEFMEAVRANSSSEQGD